jgi:hypothetical protein
MRFTANSIPMEPPFFSWICVKTSPVVEWLPSKIAGGRHAATSIWNEINRLGLVAPWCDPGPRHHRKSPIPKDSSSLLQRICRPVG